MENHQKCLICPTNFFLYSRKVFDFRRENSYSFDMEISLPRVFDINFQTLFLGYDYEECERNVILKAASSHFYEFSWLFKKCKNDRVSFPK